MVRKKKNKTTNLKPIIRNEFVISDEPLPFPLVHYPGPYGTFIAFQANKKNKVVFCGCFRNAIENYFSIYTYGFRRTDPRIGTLEFPDAVLRRLKSHNVSSFAEFIDLFGFEHKLCHECNRILPPYRYCHEYYGSSFKQNYGWYVNKQAYEFGINPHSTASVNVKLSGFCPQEIIDFIDIGSESVKEAYQEYKELKEISQVEAWKLLNEQLAPVIVQNKNIMKIVENIVREKFGHKKIGESWVNETDLFYIISSLYPNLKILRHHRPTFLGGLEMDIFLPEKGIGVEYQGIQHFEPIDNWGGLEALERLQMRDMFKKMLCEKNNIRLIYFYHYELLGYELVKSKLDEIIL